MLSLAKYAMHGRRQAILIVLVCGFFPLLYFVSAAVVGLVNLRKNWQEGLIILLWSLLPAGILWTLGGNTPIVLMIGVAICSQILRLSNSWQNVFIFTTVLGVVAQVSLNWQAGYIEQLRQIMTEAIELQISSGATVQFTADQIIEVVLGLSGFYHTASIIACLILARWWQASLYKPGGFQQEFHQLHVDPRFMMLLLALILGGLLAIPPLNSWVAIFSLPPMLNGLAVMHGIVGLKKMGLQWLILCYLTLLLMSPIIVIAGFLDSVFDFRKRIRE